MQQNPTVSIAANGNLNFCSGSSVNLAATASSGVTYQWKKNNVNISGATSSTYNANASGAYLCKVTNSCGTKTSNTLNAVKKTTPTATVSPSPSVTICAGDTATLTANTVNNASYQWIKGANSISGATSTVYKATTAGSYKVRITSSSGCSKTSSATTVTINCRETENFSEADFLFYPNPANEELIIEMQIETAGGELVIANALGQVVYKSLLTPSVQERVSVAGWEPGIYFISLINDVHAVPQKLIITH